MTLQDIPAFNAIFNALATVFMTLGFIFIKQGKREAHRAMMLSALIASAIFLVGYVTYHALKHGVHTPFGGEGVIRTVYYTMLISHIILAAAVAYLVPQTFWFAIKGNYETHKKWARFTFPIWYYVSVTGVLVYFFLYQWWPKVG